MTNVEPEEGLDGRPDDERQGQEVQGRAESPGEQQSLEAEDEQPVQQDEGQQQEVTITVTVSNIPKTKLMVVAALGALVLLLAIAVLLLQQHVVQQRILLNKRSAKTGSTKIVRKTDKDSIPTNPEDLFLWKTALPPSASSRATTAQVYWNFFQRAVWMDVDDAGEQSHVDDASMEIKSLQDNMDFLLESTGTASSNVSAAVAALQAAAQLGHPQAQHYMANALSSGIWPVLQQPDEDEATPVLQIAEDFFHVGKQQKLAWLYWHMSAIAGHVESAMALAFRYDSLRNSKDVKSLTKAEMCEQALPYYREAAHGIMDELEASIHSRAKVLPPSEKHMLHQVHLHGGTASQLDSNNKPYEAMDALQFYHFRATLSDPDPSAVYALANLYNFGTRGVNQNLTLALQYYEIAAKANLWEAAGQAGLFHFWGMGMEPHERDLFKAHKYFRMGMPGGLAGCQRRYEEGKDVTRTDVIPCDYNCLHGMGLLNLVGVPLIVDVDEERAVKLLDLAKKYGSVDATYNLAMIKMGWKLHYHPTEKVLQWDDQGQSVEADPGLPAFVQLKNHLAPGPTDAEKEESVQYLQLAAGKRHLQAIHRLAMLYEVGMPTSEATRKRDPRKLEIVRKSCKDALAKYKLITEIASPQVSRRLRKAYRLYTNGDIAESLRNYLAAAEIGSNVGHINAAFLMERGECLGLNLVDCAKASVRLWKAAASAGHPEAYLRVGDFYYYGRLSEENRKSYLDGPFGWFQYVVFPERHLFPLFSTLLGDLIESLFGTQPDESEKQLLDDVCQENDEDGTCNAVFDDQDEDAKGTAVDSMAAAAHYYRVAADTYATPRAFFNLGFLHEWGLGVKQDFPLSKRYYDLASSGPDREAELAVSISLWFLAVHEYVSRIWNNWEGNSAAAIQITKSVKVSSKSIDTPSPKNPDSVGHPVPSSRNLKRTKTEVVVDHIFSLESVIILGLTIILVKLLELRERRRRR